MAHGRTAYFSWGYNVYSYTVSEDKWTKLPQCKYKYFAMAVINDALTTIGGKDDWAATNKLLSLSGRLWEEVLPPMPTEEMNPAAANTPTHLVVARGGQNAATVEVLNTETLQWSTASSLPEEVWCLQMTTCGGCLYLADDKSNAFSCSVEDLLKSTNSSDGGSVWTRLANIPGRGDFSLTTLRGRVLAIGGRGAGGNPTRAIHCYDMATMATNSWSVIDHTLTPRCNILTAVVSSNELVVVGGKDLSRSLCCNTEIGSSFIA